MKIEQYTYWSMTINNPEDNDWVLVKNPNEKYVRSLVWSREVGAEGTEHIQAWVRLQRNNSLTFMKKLYPRGHFRYIDRDEYNENTQQYAQKEDETTAGKHHITLHDPLPANDTLLYRVLKESFETLVESDSLVADLYKNEGFMEVWNMLTLKRLDTPFIEKKMVMERAGLEKIFVSPAYEKMKTTFWRQILYRLYVITEDGTVQIQPVNGTETACSQTEGSSCQSDEDGSSETDEGSSESSGDQSDEEDDW